MIRDIIYKQMIKQITWFLLLSFALFLFSGCPYGGYKYEMGQFPIEPVNFEAVNSEYDDYNSTAPVIESSAYLFFSSNRHSNGGDFDITGDNFHILFDKDDGNLDVDTKPVSWKNYKYTDSLLFFANTGYNELGPQSLPYYTYLSGYSEFRSLLIYSNDETGNLDLKFTWFHGEGYETYPEDGTYYEPQPISFLNSPADDAYLTFYSSGYVIYEFEYWDPSTLSELLFCSDRNGDFDLFGAPVPNDIALTDFLSGSGGVNVTPVSLLNSGSDDKCPYVNGQLLVFCSDRPGGFGGFDLYYSRRNGDVWSEPVNFGERINTANNEYRPVIIPHYEFKNDMLLFSSDRPGGKGGYDLYYVGIPQMTY